MIKKRKIFKRPRVIGVLLGILFVVLIFYIRSITYGDKPPELNEKFALAKVESEKLTLGDFLGSKDYKYKDSTGGRLFGRTCVRGGYNDQTKSGNGWRCAKGYIKYYGLNGFDDTKLSEVTKYMAGFGWKVQGYPEEFESLKRSILDDNSQTKTLSFLNSDNLSAAVRFARPLSFRNPCENDQLCNLSNYKSNKKYPAVAEVTVYYSTETP